MPMYEYACKKCQHAFEALVIGTDDDVACPQCRSDELEKQWSVPAKLRTAGASTGCDNTNAPPCGPACGRWPG